MVFLVIFLSTIPLASLVYLGHRRRKQREDLHRADDFNENPSNESDLENPAEVEENREEESGSQSDRRKLSALTESLSFSSSSSEAEDEKHDDQSQDQGCTTDDMVDCEEASRIMSFLNIFAPIFDTAEADPL